MEFRPSGPNFQVFPKDDRSIQHIVDEREGPAVSFSRIKVHRLRIESIDEFRSETRVGSAERKVLRSAEPSELSVLRGSNFIRIDAALKNRAKLLLSSLADDPRGEVVILPRSQRGSRLIYTRSLDLRAQTGPRIRARLLQPFLEDIYKFETYDTRALLVKSSRRSLSSGEQSWPARNHGRSQSATRSTKRSLRTIASLGSPSTSLRSERTSLALEGQGRSHQSPR
ncbi:hypothetical protein KM043_003180 [Ampulex compressa]|nr:hypothetical protein KM043_003180 [Ampulex compressa]